MSSEIIAKSKREFILADNVFRFISKREVLDIDRIQEFRRDFLMLMKNADRIGDYETAIEWSGYITKWTNDFDDYIYKHLIDELKNLGFQKKISEGDVKYWDKLIRENVWPFVTEFRVPIFREDSYHSKEMVFEKFKNELSRWKLRTENKARVAWKVLKDFANWYVKNHETSFVFDVPVAEKIEMEGFAITILTGNSSKYINENMPKWMGLLKEGLRRYRDRASKIYPWLLKNQLPLVVDFKMDLGTGALYEYNRIVLSGYLSANSPNSLVHVLAHEMGHHRYKTMGSEQRDFWYSMINGDLGTLDLRDVANKYADNIWLYENVEIKRDDPMLFYQLSGLQYSQNRSEKFKNIDQVKDIKEYLNNGGDPIIQVHRKPISAYANKNEEEAFCEALSYLVAFGPRSLDSDVLDWLRIILPSSHTASVQEIIYE